MPVSKAVILPLELLGVHVDIKRFITKILIEAKKHNPRFTYKASLARQCQTLTKSFNAGKIKHDMFSSTLLSLLEMPDYSLEKFWQHWNAAMNTSNKISNALQNLQALASDNNCLIYIVADINPKHLTHLDTLLKKYNIPLETSTQPATIDIFPLYVSHTCKRTSSELIKVVLADIANKKSNRPDAIFIVADDSNKSLDTKQKQQSQADLTALQLLGDERKQIIHYEGGDLLEILQQKLADQPKEGYTSSDSLSLSR